MCSGFQAMAINLIMALLPQPILITKALTLLTYTLIYLLLLFFSIPELQKVPGLKPGVCLFFRTIPLLLCGKYRASLDTSISAVDNDATNKAGARGYNGTDSSSKEAQHRSVANGDPTSSLQSCLFSGSSAAPSVVRGPQPFPGLL